MKKSQSELFDMLAESPVKPGQIWRHYKGGTYHIEDLLVDCNTNEIDVVYTIHDPFETTSIKFTRPLSEWFDEVTPGIQRFDRLRNRTFWVTERELKMIEPLIGNNYKEVKANERLGRMRKLWNGISRRLGF